MDFLLCLLGTCLKARKHPSTHLDPVVQITRNSADWGHHNTSPRAKTRRMITFCFSCRLYKHFVFFFLMEYCIRKMTHYLSSFECAAIRALQTFPSMLKRLTWYLHLTWLLLNHQSNQPKTQQCDGFERRIWRHFVGLVAYTTATYNHEAKSSRLTC